MQVVRNCWTMLNDMLSTWLKHWTMMTTKGGCGSQKIWVNRAQYPLCHVDVT